MSNRREGMTERKASLTSRPNSYGERVARHWHSEGVSAGRAALEAEIYEALAEYPAHCRFEEGACCDACFIVRALFQDFNRRAESDER